MAQSVVAPSGRTDDEHAAVLKRLQATRQAIVAELRKRIVGQEEAIDQVLTAMFAGGHCMIQGPPGTAKTVLIATLAKVVDLDFKRIQFTPGPDALGHQRHGNPGRRPDHRPPLHRSSCTGPVFTNILMADEINRTPPKTQAALLEVMQEKQVTVGGQTNPLPQPFYVLATQISMEQEGTYPLPEAQQDRFMLSIMMDYLPRGRGGGGGAADRPGAGKVELKRVIGGERPAGASRRRCATWRCRRRSGRYIVDLVASSRPTGDGLRRTSSRSTWPGARGCGPARTSPWRPSRWPRRTAGPPWRLRDVRKSIVPVLRHRIGLSFRAEVDRVSVEVDRSSALVKARLPCSGDCQLNDEGVDMAVETAGIRAGRRSRSPGLARLPASDCCAEIGKVIIGQDEVVDDVLIGVLRRRALPDHGRAGPGQDAADLQPGPGDGPEVHAASSSRPT